MAKIQSLSESKSFLFQVTKQLIFFAITSIVVIAIFALSFTNKANAAQVESSEGFNQSQIFSSPMPKISGNIVDGDKAMIFIDGELNGIADVSEDFFQYYPFL